MAIYAKCQSCDAIENAGKATETLRRAVAHAVETGHWVEVTGTPASVTKDQTVLIRTIVHS